MDVARGFLGQGMGQFGNGRFNNKSVDKIF